MCSKVLYSKLNQGSIGKILDAMAVTRYPQSINTSNSGVRIICLMKYTAVVYVYIQNTNEYAGNIRTKPWVSNQHSVFCTVY